MAIRLSFRPDSVPLRGHLSIAGKNCMVSCNDERVLRSLHRWAGKAHRHDLEVNVIVDDRVRRSDATAVFRGMNHLVFASLRNEWFGFDALRKKVFGVVSRDTAEDEKFWNEMLLPITIGVMGCSIGVVPLHCACLEWKGEGLLVAGHSGAGKSTLSAALAQCGFSFISDDWTYVSNGAEHPVAHGLGTPIKLLPDSQRFFDVLRNHEVKTSMNGELAFEVGADSFSAAIKLRTRPRRLLLLEREADGGNRFEPIGSEPVRNFFERSSEHLPNALQEARMVRSQIIESIASLEAWQFTYSGSPHDAADAVKRFVEP